MLKRIFIMMIASLLLLNAVKLNAASNEYSLKITDEYVRIASEFVEKISNKKFEEVAAFFEKKTKETVPPLKLKQLWEMLLLQMGTFEKQLGYKRESGGKHEVVSVACRFKAKISDLKIVINREKKVAGFFLVESTFEKNEGAENGTIIPPYADKRKFTEKEIKAGLKEWILPGTLTIPKGNGPFPAVVLVHGSGSNDRDATILKNKPFRDLAWGLASQGIAVLRYDKRNFHYKAKLSPYLKTFTLDDETVDDAVAMVEYLSKVTWVDKRKIYVLGHSLGGMAIPRIARKDTGNVSAGFIIMAGGARQLLDYFVEQYEYIFNLDGQLLDYEKKLLTETRKQVALIESKSLSPDTSPGDLIPGTNASYWLDLRGYVPAVEALKIRRPMLILHGGRDYQVTMKDYEIWKSKHSGRKNVEIKLFPSLNHLMISGEGKSTPEDYQSPGYVSPDVIETISGWISAM